MPDGSWQVSKQRSNARRLGTLRRRVGVGLACAWIGEGESEVRVSGQSPPAVVNRVVMMAAESDEIVSSCASTMLPKDDVMDLPNCVVASGESASTPISDSYRLAHRLCDDTLLGRDCIEMSTWVEK